ncbi:hypothetical protein LOTGIDRAFT_107905 [Lottia gigantea]|uniref:hypoxia-inducible factor-proline dioxygenase n=1 Tax=Lottia gigantea TaxID=225164 RepID=V3ZSC5_LOTGI|nr:hypothetical protein LOTGIDRAFT_107905 [Lottia gigantea]ESO85435.1 hypothetical protein LOTGIDRAFT_107905 [Lottia gigantea]
MAQRLGEENINNLEKLVCQLCGTLENLSLCGGCRDTWYCCKEHQKADWKKHKGSCKRARKKNIPVGNIASENGCNGAEKPNKKIENETEASFSEHISSKCKENTQTENLQSGQKQSSESFQTGSMLTSRFDMLAKYVVECLTKYGVCVIDNFLGDSKGTEVLEEVKRLQRKGLFTEGQLVNSTNSTSQNIRGDVLTWVDGSENGCCNTHFLISCMDDIILRCAGQLESYDIQERTKAMVACYPGNKTGYIKHVDNPNGDGRCVTCIYYLNKGWDVTKHGGMLRIYPEGQDLVANIEPTFDRVLYFWSDRRNPHEVRETIKERYAITIWYYDSKERRNALQNSRGKNLFFFRNLDGNIILNFCAKLFILHA